METWKRVNQIENMQAAVSIVGNFVGIPIICIFVKIYKIEYPARTWLIFGCILITGLIIGILQAIIRILNPPPKYSKGGGSHITYGSGGDC